MKICRKEMFQPKWKKPNEDFTKIKFDLDKK